MSEKIELWEIDHLIENAYLKNRTAVASFDSSEQQRSLVEAFQQQQYRQMALILEQVADYFIKANVIEDAVIMYQNAIYCLSFDSQEQHLSAAPIVGDFGVNLKEFKDDPSYWAPDLFQLDKLSPVSTNENNLCLRLLIKTGTTYLLKTQKNVAIEFYTRALSIIDPNNPDTLELYAMLLANQAIITLHGISNIDHDPEADLLKAIEIFRFTNNRRNEVKAFSIFASIERDVKKNYPKAERLYTQYIEFNLQNQTDIRGLVRNYVGLGVLYVFKKQYQQASQSFNSALQYKNGLEQYQNLWWPVYWGLGSCFYAEEKYEKAQENFEQSLHYIEQLQDNLKSDEGKVTFIESVQHVYNALLDTLVGRYKNNEISLSPILDLMEKMRGQSFKDLKSDSIQHNFADTPIHRLLFQLQPTYTVVLSVDIHHNISGHFPNLGEEYWGPLISNFQNGIGKELFSRDTIDSFGSTIASSENMDALFKRLYQDLLEPIEKYLPPSGEQILIEPDGVLWQLPLHLFQNKAGTYLAEIWPITYCASLEVYELLKNRLPKRPNNPSFFFAAVGVPQRIENNEFKALPFAIDEVNSIVKTLNIPPSSIYIDEGCTEAVVKEKTPDCRVVHLATHGHAVLEKPMDSYIVLFGQNGQNTRLTATDTVKSLKLNNCEMVVLSACKSGLGKIMNEGMIGLARAFLIVGAKSVLVSLWSVPDESTKQLMESFYRHLLQGQNKSTALQKAMLELKNQEGTSQPKFWAPFVLIGNEAPLNFN